MKTNTMAILFLIFAFFFPLMGAIFGHVAVSQFKTNGEEGSGLALAGIIVGWVFTGFWAL
jgi:peptidyl-prolyl cis-trans isomerase B (cyclophilin B)